MKNLLGIYQEKRMNFKKLYTMAQIRKTIKFLIGPFDN